MSATLVAAAATGGTGDAAQARRLAGEILSGSRFHPPGLPRPLHGAFQTLGGWLKPLGHALGDAYGWVSHQVSGHPVPGALALAVVAVVLVVVAVAMGRRVSRLRAPSAAGAPGRPVPRDLRLAAAEAERNGDLTAALRLYFAATILELQAAGRLPPEYSLTAGQARRLLHSPHFDRMALAFEKAFYGGRPVEPGDLEVARSATGAEAPV